MVEARFIITPKKHQKLLTCPDNSRTHREIQYIRAPSNNNIYVASVADSRKSNFTLQGTPVLPLYMIERRRRGISLAASPREAFWKTFSNIVDSPKMYSAFVFNKETCALHVHTEYEIPRINKTVHCASGEDFLFKFEKIRPFQTIIAKTKMDLNLFT